MITFISVVHLWLLFKVVSFSISISASSFPKFISNSFLNLATLSLTFYFDTRFFSGYCLSHLRFNLKINSVSLHRSSSAVVTSHLFSLSVYLDKRCLFEHHCLCNLNKIFCHSFLKIIIHPYHCFCSFH